MRDVLEHAGEGNCSGLLAGAHPRAGIPHEKQPPAPLSVALVLGPLILKSWYQLRSSLKKKVASSMDPK